MFRRSSNSRRSGERSANELNWALIEDPNCVGEPGWDTELKALWTCTTCKKYVKMHHLAKLWPRAQAVVSVHRWEGPTSNCSSDHFRQWYYEVHDAVGLPNSKPTIMNYSTMAMVWAEIVLHKDVDWRTVYGRNVDRLNRSQHMIPTNWTDRAIVCHNGQIAEPMCQRLQMMMWTLRNGKCADAIILKNGTLRIIRLHLEHINMSIRLIRAHIVLDNLTIQQVIMDLPERKLMDRLTMSAVKAHRTMRVRHRKLIDRLIMSTVKARRTMRL
jgi:hypothetical protein